MNVKTNSPLAWWLAIRPKTLTGAAAPVLVGGSMAFVYMASSMSHDDWSAPSFIQWLPSALLPFGLCLLFAIVMQIDANLINDYFDFKKGTDREDRLGPERACSQGWITPIAMQLAIAIVTILSCLVGLLILLLHMQYELLLVGFLCVLFCFLYTTKLSYLGWGDILVFIFFGLVPVFFTCYVMTEGEWCVPIIIAGAAMGLATDTLLVVNNYRDREQDAISGKRTVIVRIMEKYSTSGLYGRASKEGKSEKSDGASKEGKVEKSDGASKEGKVEKADEASKESKVEKADGASKEGLQACHDLYLWLGVFATILGIVALFMYPLTSIRYPFMVVYLILHFRTFQRFQSLDGRELNAVLGETARNIFLFGLLFAANVLIGQ